MIGYGVRNLWRNPGWSVVVILMIGLGFLSFLLMSAIGTAMDRQVQRIKGHVRRILQVRPAGSLGHVNMAWEQDILLPAEALDTLRDVPHVVQIEPYLLAMEPMPNYFMIMHIGVHPPHTKRLESHGEVGNPMIIAGRDLQAEDAGQRVGVIGKAYGEKFGITPETLGPHSALVRQPLTPGKGLKASGLKSSAGKPIKIIGIFSSGYRFGDNQLFLPFDTFQVLYGVEGVSRLYVTVDTVEHVSLVQQRLRSRLGEAVEVIAPTEGARFVSRAGGTIKLLADFWVMLSTAMVLTLIFGVMLLVSRTRLKEIGALKTMGASHLDLALQQMGEAMGLSLLGAALGTLAFFLVGRLVGQAVFTVTMLAYLPVQYSGDLYGHLQVDYGANGLRLLSVLGVALLLGILGSLYGVVRSVRLSPVEALRDGA